jgi:hypothetical protein
MGLDSMRQRQARSRLRVAGVDGAPGHERTADHLVRSAKKFSKLLKCHDLIRVASVAKCQH